MRTWKLLLLPAVAVLLATSPLRAAEGGGELEKLSKKIDQLVADIQSLKKDVNDIGLRGAQTVEAVQDLNRRLDDLRDQVSRMDSARRRAFAITPENTDTVRVPPTGTILLRNRSGVTGTFYVNGQSHVLLPGESLRVAGVPAGAFTYEIAAEPWGIIRPLTTRVLPGNTTYVLNIEP